MGDSRRTYLAGSVVGHVGGLGGDHPGGRLRAGGQRSADRPGGGHHLLLGATWLKRRLRADDSLDVFGVHGVGGVLGSVLTAVFADPVISGVHANLLSQVTAVAAVAAYSAAGTALLLLLVRLVMPLRVSAPVEQQGLDLAIHMERQH